MASYEKEAPLGEEQIVIPVLSEEEVKLENEKEEVTDENNDLTLNLSHHINSNIGNEVKLESRDNDDFAESQRQMTTSQDDYELISSKQSSHASIDHEKTPTPPPEIIVDPTPSPPPSPAEIGVSAPSSTTIVIEDLEPSAPSIEIEEKKPIQVASPSLWQTFLNAIAAFTHWIQWLVGAA